MLPDWWQAAVLALGTFRIVRLVAYDTFPPIARARAWLTGEEWVQSSDPEIVVVPVYGRPLLADLLDCPFCLGLWLSGGVYAAWLEAPHVTLYAAFPFALSAAVGLIAKNLDA